MAIHREIVCTHFKGQFQRQAIGNAMKFHPDSEKSLLQMELLKKSMNPIYIKRPQILLKVGHGETNLVGSVCIYIEFYHRNVDLDEISKKCKSVIVYCFPNFR